MSKKWLVLVLVAAIFLPGAVSYAQSPSIAELAAQVASLQAQIEELKLQIANTNIGVVEGASVTVTGPTVTVMPTAAMECTELTYRLVLGSSDKYTNGEVTKLQKFLIAYFNSTNYTPTGYFGKLTQTAVQNFQAKEGIVSSGTPETTGYGAVGWKTRTRIKEISCGTLPPPPIPPPPPPTGTTTPSTDSVTVISPNGEEMWAKDAIQTIKWQNNRIFPVCPAGAACSPPAPLYNDIRLAPYYPPCTGSVCPMYPYVAPYTIAKNVGNGGGGTNSYEWIVGKNTDGLDVPAGQYQMEVCYTNTNVCDKSDTKFDITTAQSPRVSLSSGGTIANGLAPRGTIVPFTSVLFANESGKPVKLVSLSVKLSGLLHPDAFDRVLLLDTKSGQVLATGRIETPLKGDLVGTLWPVAAVSFSGSLNVTVAGLMTKDLSAFAGEAGGISVTGGVFTDGTGQFGAILQSPITGATNTINNSLSVGTLSVSGATPGTSFSSLMLTAGPEENVTVKGITLRSSGGSVKVGGYPYTCVALFDRELCVFGTSGITISKGTNLVVEPAWSTAEISGTYDINAAAFTSGYRIAPTIGTTGTTTPPQTSLVAVVSPNGGQTFASGQQFDYVVNINTPAVDGYIQIYLTDRPSWDPVKGNNYFIAQGGTGAMRPMQIHWWNQIPTNIVPGQYYLMARWQTYNSTESYTDFSDQSFTVNVKG